MLGLIKRTIKCRSVDEMLLLYKSLVRPHVEYCSSVWSPYFKKDKNQIEKIQHQFTRLFPDLINKPYEDRLDVLALWSLEERRIRADLIEVFKIIKGFSNLNHKLLFDIDTSSRTRGHSFKIIKHRFSSLRRQYTFSQRIISGWNSLSDNYFTFTKVQTKVQHWAILAHQ